jgi:hypothetical protein
MAYDPKELVARAKASLQGMLKRVPNKIGGLGIEATREYKKALTNAQKLLASPRASYPNLRIAVVQLQSYED